MEVPRLGAGARSSRIVSRQPGGPGGEPNVVGSSAGPTSRRNAVPVSRGGAGSETSPGAAPAGRRDRSKVARARLSWDSEEYLSWLAVEVGRSANTIAAYRRDLRSYEELLLARRLDLDDVTRSVIEDYLAYLRASGMARSSISRALAAVRGLHRFRLDEGLASGDPTADVSGPRVPPGLPKALSEEEVKRLISAVTGEGPFPKRDLAMLEVLYGAGVRISELVGLSMGDLDLSAGLMKVLGKGNKERLVPVGGFAARALDDWLGGSGRALLVPQRWARRSDATAIFLSRLGTRLTRQGAWGVVRHYGALAGLSDRLTPHVLRHSCATHMLDHGADIRVVQELLGHASITTTQIYTRVTPEHLRRAYELAHPRAQGSNAH